MQVKLFVSKLLFFICFSIFSNFIFAQSKITINVLDAKTKETIPFAIVKAVDINDTSIVLFVKQTDTDGQLELDNLQSDIRINVQYVGYQSFFKKISLQGPAIINVYLNTLSTILKEVEITDYVNPIEYQADKKVVNVDKDLTSVGGTALDVLKNTPSVSVDVDGNVSLRGNSGIRLLIDGKPTTLTASILLDQLPASVIKQIEIITNPSAKYDSEGSGGIINIITKKSQRKGLSGTITSGIGTGNYVPEATFGKTLELNKANFSTALSYIYKKHTFTINADIRKGKRWNSLKNDRTQFYNTLDSNVLLKEINQRIGLSNNQNIKLGYDYQIDTLNSVYISGNIRNSNQDNNQSFQYLREYQNGNNTSVNLLNQDRSNEEIQNNLGYDLTTGYRKLYLQKGKEWTFDAILSQNKKNRKSSIDDIFFPSFNSTYFENIKEKNKSQTVTFQTDFTQPFANKLKLEAGAKAVFDDFNQNVKVDTLNQNLNQKFNTDSFRTNEFTYRQSVIAAYLIGNKEIGKWSFKTGLRFEQTFIDGYSQKYNFGFKKSLINLFPSVFASYQLKNDQTLTGSYSKRINRPGAGQLLPFPDYSNKFSYRVGNPSLLPEISQSLEAGYNITKKVFSFSSTIFYRYSERTQSRYITTDPQSGIAVTSYANLKNTQTSGLELIYSQFLAKFARVMVTYSGFYSRQAAGEKFNNRIQENFVQNGLITLSLTPRKGSSIQIIQNYRGPSLTPQGKFNQIYYTDLGYNQDILKNKLSLNLRVSDIFNQLKFGINLNTSEFKSDFKFKFESRVVMATLSYKINNGLEKKERKKADTNNMNNNSDVAF